MSAELVLLIGLPGSGKTTMAQRYLAENPAARVRLNRDDYRLMLTGLDSPAVWALPVERRVRIEALVTLAQVDALDSALAAGWSVVVDDTNLRADRRAVLKAVAQRHGVPVHEWSLLHVPLAECIARDAARGEAGGRLVGAGPITAMHESLTRV